MRSPTTDRRIMRDKDQQLKTWGFPRVMALYHPNDGTKSTEDRFNWIQAVHLDRRLTEQERLVLIRLAQYLNLKTQQCDPTVGHLAMMAGLGEGESATRMARNALSRGEALGWIRRYRRSGGRGKYNQSNSYKFLVPRDVTPAGLAERVRVQVVERDDEWYVAQVKDGVQICGPIKTREVAESWATEHGPGSLALSSPREPESLTGVFRRFDRSFAAV